MLSLFNKPIFLINIFYFFKLLWDLSGIFPKILKEEPKSALLLINLLLIII